MMDSLAIGNRIGLLEASIGDRLNPWGLAM